VWHTCSDQRKNSKETVSWGNVTKPNCPFLGWIFESYWGFKSFLIFGSPSLEILILILGLDLLWRFKSSSDDWNTVTATAMRLPSGSPQSFWFWFSSKVFFLGLMSFSSSGDWSYCYRGYQANTWITILSWPFAGGWASSGSVTKYRIWGPNNRYWFSHRSGGWKFKIKVWAGFASSEASLLGL
jgi:hypothetical protein